ncbi:hypothetical protein E2P84_44105 [Burkholderia cepacia]|uniref:Microcin J25-processing protein McjB C-terminal domain-containing protein n=1 Tax=Burkholderia cepacia TaxID=292 RepID=A0AAX2RRY3_BURCE|nr:hypothetical protein [Burkholderia cepacia]TES60686.1 hypothetical protein E2P84_44105 [Burkholderia cepacia]TET01639.1 hypothetical protein E3D36_16525 [Burkholderia cepacia]TEU47497.1 hypothetical protein E3D37_15955 [Burkholderia cepacia]TEU53524.1 hypothetical protein E3D38_12345 [Burkholderia cepacia]TEV02130.1 hypothetical protein E3D40_13275 [Burkholderia cepacia]
MGEAKRRKAEIDELKRARDGWRQDLTADEKAIAEVAERLHERLVVERGFVGGCYQLAFFLRLFLKERCGIEVTPIVGYINDTTGPVMASHAWIEFGGKKTDISLTRTEYPEFQPPGALLIHDHVVRRGTVLHTYHLAQSTESLAREVEMARSDPHTSAVVQHKQREHAIMSDRATDDAKIQQYFKSAPPQLSYDVLARLAS